MANAKHSLILQAEYQRLVSPKPTGTIQKAYNQASSSMPPMEAQRRLSSRQSQGGVVLGLLQKYGNWCKCRQGNSNLLDSDVNGEEV
jgi:hypothetical protein